jgi:hypothetical protein
MENCLQCDCTDEEKRVLLLTHGDYYPPLRRLGEEKGGAALLCWNFITISVGCIGIEQE